jgi:O-succinylbenzoate synthase
MIRELNIHPFSLRIRSLTAEKKGFLLEAKTETTSAWAEVSPLPGFSKESIEETKEQLFFLQKQIPFSLEEILEEQ